MIDKSKQYRTRDGREVRIYATDGGGHKPIHGAIREDENWIAYTWLYDGVAALDCNSLIEVRPRIKREVWVNIYRGREIDWMTIHDERDEADDYPDHHKTRIACVRLTIDCEEGDGL